MKKTIKFKIGLVLMVISIVAFLMLPVIPFLHVEKGVKYVVTTSLFIFAEVTFWVGGILMGKELFDKYKSLLNPKNWKKSKTEEDSDEDQK
jgi:MFS-type transporter involved in bile tolerance (Atg22 family)